MASKETGLSKITQPKVEGVLLREDLFRRLDQGRQGKLIWVTSPGGAGKTTLIASYLNANKLPCLWYQIDGGDADPATFFYYLGLAGKKAAPRRKKSLPLLTPEYLRGLSDFSRNFFADLFGRLAQPSAVVFDNVQEVQDAATLHQCLIDGLDRIPEDITLVLISRSAPAASYLRFQANREMQILDWNDLRLTPDEFEKILACWGFDASPIDSLQKLYVKMDGWAAGLQLLLRQADEDSLGDVGQWDETPEEIFAYFADQLFNKSSTEVQHCLLSTAFVTKTTLRMAEKLSGNARSKTILKDLAHRNYFTKKRQEGVTTYEYHPLFQRFLQDTASQGYSQKNLIDLKRRSAQALVAESRIEEVVELLSDIKAWEELISQVLQNAQALLDQGRLTTLTSWLELIPAEQVEKHPWLLFWKAVGLKPFDIFRSRELFTQSYELFRAKKDPVGSYMAWTGAVETFIYLWGNFRLLDPWLAEFENLRRDFPNFPNPEIQARVTSSVFGALLWRKSNSREMKVWSQQAEELIRIADNPTFRILTGSNMLKYHLWCRGDLAQAEILISRLQKIDRQTIPPLAILLFNVMLATYFFFKNEMNKCLDVVNEGLELGKKTGIHLMDTALCAHGTYGMLMTGNREQASFYLKQMAQLTDERSHIDVAHYHYLYAWMYLEEGRYSEALHHARIAVERIDAAGTRQARGFARYTLAAALGENGEFEEAKEQLRVGRAYGISMHNDYFEAAYHLFMAVLNLRQGDRSASISRLGKALPIARQKGYPVIPWICWYRSALLELLQLALENDIEVEYASKLIKDHCLQPKTPPVHLENWPWPLKIHTLGSFEIYRYGELLRSPGKTQQKPLALLKAIIALGGKDVSAELLIDALWPDAEGDAALQSLKTALHRLRKLIGLPEAIVYVENHVSLNPRYCWVDVWALDRLLSQVRTERIAPAEMPALSRALALYQGNFLANERSESWIIPARERWRSRFLRGTECFAEHLAREGQTEAAIECYLKALDIDPLVELFYQRLMLCYKQLNRRTSALSVYNRCRSTFEKTLGLKPSPQTEDIRKTLLPKV